MAATRLQASRDVCRPVIESSLIRASRSPASRERFCHSILRRAEANGCHPPGARRLYLNQQARQRLGPHPFRELVEEEGLVGGHGDPVAPPNFRVKLSGSPPGVAQEKEPAARALADSDGGQDVP